MMEYVFTSDEQTQEFAREFASTLHGGEVILLTGDLGAGKTTFVKGLAAGLGVKAVVTSPTFVLMSVYPVHGGHKGVRRLAHVDTYRLKDEQALLDIGILDFLGALDTITAIEWPEKVNEFLENIKTKIIRVELKHKDADTRELLIS